MIQIESCDILFATDESVNAKTCVDNILTATKTMKKKLDYLQRSLPVPRIAPFTMCKKAFFVIDGASSPLDSVVGPWIHMLPSIQGNLDMCFILHIGEADSAKLAQYEAMGLDSDTVVYVKSMDMLASWWPRALRFLYNVNKQGSENASDVYIWPTQSSDNEVKTLTTTVDSLLTNAGLTKGNTPEESKAVVAVLTSPLADNDTEVVTKLAEISNIEGKTVHIIMADAGAQVNESENLITFYDKSELMKFLLWIMSDLRYVGHRRPRKEKPKSCVDICKAVLKYILIAFGILIGLPFGLAYVSVSFSIILAFFVFALAIYILFGPMDQKKVHAQQQQQQRVA